MNELAGMMDVLTGSAASALVSAVWQGALLALMVWACLRFVPGLGVPELPAAARSVVWLCVFVLLVGLQIAPMALHGGASPMFAEKAQPVFHLDPRWSVVLAALWLAASAVRAAQLVQGVLHLRRLTAGLTEVPQDAELAAVLEEASAGRRVRLCTSDAIARPSVIGFFQPRVLIPARLLGELSANEMRQVLTHELEHLRRADDWTNLLQKVALVVFPLNPVLAWVERRLCAERELACDDRVLAAGGGRKAYALCLTHLAEFALLERGFSLVLGAWERRPELVRRVHRILSAPAQAMNRRAALGVSGGVLAAAVCGAVALAHGPQLVSFGPMPTMAQSTEPVSGIVSERRALHEGTAVPRLVGASVVMERHSVVKPVAVVSHSRAGRKAQECGTVTAVARAARKVAAPEVKLAGLRIPPPPGNDALLVMTEWNDLGGAQKMMLTEFHEQQQKKPAAVPAVYLVVTPNGWLIVQI